MSLIDVRNISKSFAGDILFKDVSFRLLPQQKLALIGNNGVGKTTLLKMILGEESVDNGSIIVAPHHAIGYFSQSLLTSLSHTLYEEMELVFKPLIQIETQLSKITEALASNQDNPKLLSDYGRIEHQFDELGGYQYRSKMETFLGRFGFYKKDYLRPISSFSGGERSRIALCKILLIQPAILLLDEPTNHLDIETIEWLEDYLRDYPGAIILISHDRYFIDVICDHIVEIEFGEAEEYTGNYTYYLEEKSVRFEQRLSHYQLQQKQIQHLRALIARFKPKPTKVRLARDREKKLKRIEDNALVNPYKGNPQVKFNFKTKIDHRKQLITLENIAVGYDHLLIEPFNLTLFSGDKLAILGSNGTGKTTLLKSLAGFAIPARGTIKHHRPLKIGYFDQHQIELSGTSTLFDYFHNLFPTLTHYEVRHQLGLFLFTQDEVEKPISVLSGGEKMRLAFAQLLMTHYDILLLDEPTNHLDMTTKKILENALDDYPGTVIFVSHDRYFVDEVATQVGIIQNRQISFFNGNYSQFRLSMKESVNPISDKKEKNPNEVTTKPLVKKRKKEDLEVEITALENNLKQLYEAVNIEENYTDHIKLREIEEQIEDSEDRLKTLEKEYFEEEGEL